MQDKSKLIARGQSITFRVPSDAPDYALKQLQKLKETERRNFSSEIAQFVLKGVNEAYSKERESITITLPKQLTKEQKNWLKHEHSEALIGSILYQLLNDPIRATALLASLNSNASNIDDALYLQEIPVKEAVLEEVQEVEVEVKQEFEQPIFDESDLDDLDLTDMLSDFRDQEEEAPKPVEADPLADFLSNMNK